MLRPPSWLQTVTANCKPHIHLIYQAQRRRCHQCIWAELSSWMLPVWHHRTYSCSFLFCTSFPDKSPRQNILQLSEQYWLQPGNSEGSSQSYMSKPSLRYPGLAHRQCDMVMNAAGITVTRKLRDIAFRACMWCSCTARHIHALVLLHTDSSLTDKCRQKEQHGSICTSICACTQDKARQKCREREILRSMRKVKMEMKENWPIHLQAQGSQCCLEPE